MRNDIYESEIDNVDMHNETCESKIDIVDALDKINNKIDTINKINKRLAKIEIKAAEKVELIYGAVHELQDEIYRDDSWLRLVELRQML